jgi:hypothetical protein
LWRKRIEHEKERQSRKKRKECSSKKEILGIWNRQPWEEGEKELINKSGGTGIKERGRESGQDSEHDGHGRRKRNTCAGLECKRKQDKTDRAQNKRV